MNQGIKISSMKKGFLNKLPQHSKRIEVIVTKYIKILEMGQFLKLIKRTKPKIDEKYLFQFIGFYHRKITTFFKVSCIQQYRYNNFGFMIFKMCTY